MKCDCVMPPYISKNSTITFFFGKKKFFLTSNDCLEFPATHHARKEFVVDRLISPLRFVSTINLSIVKFNIRILLHNFTGIIAISV